MYIHAVKSNLQKKAFFCGVAFYSYDNSSNSLKSQELFSLAKYYCQTETNIKLIHGPART